MHETDKQKRRLDILQHFRMEVEPKGISEDAAVTIKNTQLRIGLENIVRLDVDAVVNAAQPKLTGGGGVDGAIHGTGGPAILKECLKITKKIGTLDTGKAVITTGGDLLARHVIHTVGPIWHGGVRNEPELLASSYRESLLLADENKLLSIGFPSISTGAYGYPVIQAAEIAINTVVDYLTDHPTSLKLVRFAIFSEGDLGAYKWALKKKVGNSV